MADDSVKRFHSIMDKLFHSSKPSSSGGAEASVGKKRSSSEANALALVGPNSRGGFGERFRSSPAAQAPMCQPWDRGDLMRRLATFKSMTWFAKPKVVSAVNCARRGWINVDTDTIACEACGARLLFSTPSSWSRQQVEKAAMVFSLKLDTGHKLHCPWVNNSCDETLAQFPPMPPQALVDKFRERSSMLIKLLALPVISSSALETMRGPQLEEFFKQSLPLECGSGSLDSSSTECFENESEVKSANLYYQAQKLISLCGWEPRSLPYVVECEHKSTHFVNDTDIMRSSHVFSVGNDQSKAGSNEVVMVDGNSDASSMVDADPKSVVLECKLCGANVGLWAFSLVPRPVELFRLIGNTEVGGENFSENHGLGNEDCGDKRGNVGHTTFNGTTFVNEKSSNLKMTIAGGPTPTKQNFKAIVSLPIIGRNLRARFASDSNFRESLDVHSEEIQSISSSARLLQEGSTDVNENSGNYREESGDAASLEGRNVTDQGTLTGAKDSVMEKLTNHTTKVAEDSSQNGKEMIERPIKSMEFDPIRQHRYFCPWIASSSSGAPGWQQTLSALLRGNESSRSSPSYSPSASLIKVDDPITSVRRLFMSPSPKRTKRTHDSS